MTLFILRRLVQSALVMALMSALVFLGIFVIGNPIELLISPVLDADTLRQTIARYGLDRPLWEQYLSFVGAMMRGDLGRSYVFNQPAVDLILARMPATLELALAAMLLAVAVGLPLGIHAGYRPRSAVSRVIMALSILGFSLPSFLVGLILIVVFSVELGWLPSGGRGETASLLGMRFSALTLDGLWHMVLPAINLAMFKVALIARLARAGAREILQQDYVRYARAKGVSGRRIMFVHVLKNLAIPVVTVLGLEFGSVMAFAVVTETIFNWPGMGKLIIDALAALDRPVAVAYLMIAVLIIILVNLVVDLLYAVLDPRVRLAGSAP